jgi:hypothetical protein
MRIPPCFLDDAIVPDAGLKENALLDLRHVRPAIDLQALAIPCVSSLLTIYDYISCMIPDKQKETRYMFSVCTSMRPEPKAIEIRLRLPPQTAEGSQECKMQISMPRPSRQPSTTSGH